MPVAHPAVRGQGCGVPLCPGRSGPVRRAAGGSQPVQRPRRRVGPCRRALSFESILHKYGLGNDPALVELAKIVHAADVEADIDSSPEGRGLQAIAKGFSILHGKNDHRKIEMETPMYDALYAWCRERAKI